MVGHPCGVDDRTLVRGQLGDPLSDMLRVTLSKGAAGSVELAVLPEEREVGSRVGREIREMRPRAGSECCAHMAARFGVGGERPRRGLMVRPGRQPHCDDASGDKREEQSGGQRTSAHGGLLPSWRFLSIVFYSLGR